MSKLDELIQELCPDGVEYKKLEEIVKYQRGKSITKKNVIEGDIPVISGGQQPAYYHNESNREGKTITIAGSGAYAGYIMYWEKPIFVSDAFSLKGNEININTKYIYYYLKKIQEKIYSLRKGAGISHVYFKDMQDFLVPVPPLEVQCEIVRILDKFTLLTAELTAELTARRKQYEYYRNILLNEDEEYVIKNLEDCCNILDNKRKPVTKSARVEGEYPYYGANGIQDYVDAYIFDGKYVLIGEDGSVITSNGNPIVNWAEGKIWVNNHAHIIEELTVNLKYLYYFIQTINVRDLIHGNIPKLNQRDFRKLKIKVPYKEKQNQLVEILEKFDTITNNIRNGLPAEIELNNKRYEYYRDKLLTFKEKK